QRVADGVRLTVEPCVPIAADAQHEPADRRGRSAAVVNQVAPGLVALDEDVLAERAQQIFEQLYFEIEPPDRVRQRREDQRGITAVLLDAAFGRLAQSPLPDFERRDALGIAAA